MSTNNDEASDWYDWVLKRMKNFAGNLITEERKARTVIISGSKAIGETTSLEDESLADEVEVRFDTRRINQLKSFPDANNMHFKIIDLRDYFLTLPNKTIENVVSDVKRFFPTRIIFSFSSEEYESFDIITKMKDMSLLKDEEIEYGSNYVIYDTLNIFQNDKCFLSSITATYYTGMEYSIFDALEDLANARQTNLLVISGSHCSKHGKESGFTKPNLLSNRLYKDACKFFNIGYKTKSGNQLPRCYSKFELDFELEDVTADVGKYEKLQIMVLDIKHFTNNDNEGLLKFVRQHMPHGIIIDWSFSKGCDLANRLVVSGIIPEMRLTMERTSIVGANDVWIQLDEKQKGILDDVARMIRNEPSKESDHPSQLQQQPFEEGARLKRVLLYGGHGSGKTVLGVEIAKMFLAKSRLDQCQQKQSHTPNLFVMDLNYDNPFSTPKSQLLFELEKMFLKEDGCKQKFLSTRDLEEMAKMKFETGRKLLDGLKDFIEKKSRENHNSIFLIDEMNVKNFLKWLNSFRQCILQSV